MFSEQEKYQRKGTTYFMSLQVVVKKIFSEKITFRYRSAFYYFQQTEVLKMQTQF